MSEGLGAPVLIGKKQGRGASACGRYQRTANRPRSEHVRTQASRRSTPSVPPRIGPVRGPFVGVRLWVAGAIEMRTCDGCGGQEFNGLVVESCPGVIVSAVEPHFQIAGGLFA